MKYSLFFRTDTSILCLLLFAGCILMVWLGRYIRKYFLQKDREESKSVVNLMLSALVGLWGFMLAFTFGNSASRYHDIISIMVDEQSAIRHVIYRTETFPDSIWDAFRGDLKEYVQVRINYYHAKDFDEFNKAKDDARRLSRILWRRTQRASEQPNLSTAASSMFSALITMYDLAAKRDAILESGVPDLIFYLLFFMALVISFIAGFTMHVIARKDWVVFVGFILLASMIVFVTLDISRPMRGFTKLDIAEYRIEGLQKLFSK